MLALATCLALLIAAPPAQTQADHPTPPRPESLGPLGPALARVVNEHAAALEDRDLRYVPARVGWMRTRSLELFRYLNRDLFPEATLEQAPEQPAELAIQALVATRDQLAEAGVEFLVVPFPTRLNVYPDALVELDLDPPFAGYAPGYRRVLDRLAAEGVEVLDLLPAFAAARAAADAPQSEQVFLTVNSHWSPKGLELGARLVADHIRARPWYEPPPAAAPARRTELAIEWTPPNEPLPPGVAPHPLVLSSLTTQAGAPLPASNRESPVVLLGDSFSTHYAEQSADFPRHLAYQLGAPLDVIASPGGGPNSSRAALARRRDGLTNKRLVLWSFSTHSLMNERWWLPPPR